MNKRHSIATCLLIGCLLLCAGCATHADRLTSIRGDYYDGNLDAALAELDRQIERGGNDVDVFKLDRAIVALAAGRPHEAERTMREVRDRFDYLEQATAGETALSMLTDDNTRAYAGEDYEQVLVRAMLSLASLMHDGGDALAYSLQVEQKHQQIVAAGADPAGENPKLAYRPVAFGPYLHGVLREASHGDYHDAARSYERVVSWQPEFAPGPTDLQRARFGRHSAPGHGAVYVFALVGRGPRKEEAIEAPTSAALLIADRIVSATGSHTLPPTVAPIKVPVVVRSHNEIDGVHVTADGHACGVTQTITDVGQLAVEQYEAVFPQVMARAVARRVVKKSVIYTSKDVIDGADQPLASFGLDMLGVVWEASEAADTRCWALLPDKIQVLRVELPVGEHRIGLRGASGSAAFGEAAQAVVQVDDGRNTYLLASFPGPRMVGEILVADGFGGGPKRQF